MPLGASINSEQKQELIDRTLNSARKIFTNNEKMLCTVVQQKMLFNLLPHSIVVTNKRVLRFIPKLFGESFEDFLWKDIRNAKVEENLFGCRLSLEFDNGAIILDKLPKNQAKRLYALAQEKVEEWIEKRRLRHLEEEQAASGASNISLSAGNNGTARGKLTELKNLLDEGLITQDEFHKRKESILKGI